MFCGMILRECLFRRIELRQRRVVPRAQALDRVASRRRRARRPTLLLVQPALQRAHVLLCRGWDD